MKNLVLVLAAFILFVHPVEAKDGKAKRLAKRSAVCAIIVMRNACQGTGFLLDLSADAIWQADHYLYRKQELLHPGDTVEVSGVSKLSDEDIVDLVMPPSGHEI